MNFWHFKCRIGSWKNNDYMTIWGEWCPGSGCGRGRRECETSDEFAALMDPRTRQISRGAEGFLCFRVVHQCQQATQKGEIELLKFNKFTGHSNTYYFKKPLIDSGVSSCVFLRFVWKKFNLLCYFINSSLLNRFKFFEWKKSITKQIKVD